MSAKGKIQRRNRRKFHIRKKVTGTPERPRLSVFRSIKHIYAQAIDDLSGTTVAQASTLNDTMVASLLGDGTAPLGASAAVGKVIAARLKERNIEVAVFDRNGYLYHGRVKAVADAAREAGLQL